MKQDAPVRILLWHGYLLGTWSKIYTRQLAREWLPVICRCALLSQGDGKATGRVRHENC